MYLDPAFAGMLLQLLLALLVVGGVILFSLRRKIRQFFSKKQDVVTYNQATTSDNKLESDLIDTLN